MKRTHVLVTAAGSSRRMGDLDKLTLDLDGIPLLAKTVFAFLELDNLGELVVTVNPARTAELSSMLVEHFPENRHRIRVTAGGRERQESILFGLRLLRDEALANDGDTILIHDGARPFVTRKLIRSLLEGLESFEGVIPAVPVRDTIKRVEGQSVLSTENRETLRLVQTPQAFTYPHILKIHETANSEGFTGTDDASLLEEYGGRVGWVEGSTYNLKVTVPEDIALMSYLMASTKREESAVG